MGCRVWGAGFRVWGLYHAHQKRKQHETPLDFEILMWGLGFRVEGLGLGVSESGGSGERMRSGKSTKLHSILKSWCGGAWRFGAWGLEVSGLVEPLREGYRPPLRTTIGPWAYS